MVDTPNEPPARPVTERAAKPDLKAQIAEELYVALDLVGADELQDIIGIWRQTLSDEQVLAELKEHNAKRRRSQ